MELSIPLPCKKYPPVGFKPYFEYYYGRAFTFSPLFKFKVDYEIYKW